jgi:hypothetical protein
MPRDFPKDRVEVVCAFQEEALVEVAKNCPALPPRVHGGKSVQKTLFSCSVSSQLPPQLQQQAERETMSAAPTRITSHI